MSRKKSGPSATKITSTPDDVAVASGHAQTKTSSLSRAKKERTKTDFTAYQTLYWDSKLKTTVLADWEIHRKTLDIPEKDHHKFLQAFRNKRCKELLELETDEVKAEVERVRKMSKAAVKVLKKLKQDGQTEVEENAIVATMTPEQERAKREELEERARKEALQR